jgi:hypothetical protein
LHIILSIIIVTAVLFRIHQEDVILLFALLLVQVLGVSVGCDFEQTVREG